MTHLKPEDDQVIADSVFRVGKVTSVQGRRIEIRVDKSKNSSHLIFKGDLLKNVSVGGYLKIAKGFSEIIAKVDGESVVEDFGSNIKYGKKTDKQSRTLLVSLIGFLNSSGEFKRGVRELPLIDNECYILTPEEFNTIHNFVSEGDHPLRVGSLAMERGQPVNVGIDAMLASHVGIFGNTGSGKSYTLAKLYYELFKEFKNKKGFTDNAHFVLIDFNGEYVNKPANQEDPTSTQVIVEDEYKTTYCLSTGKTAGDLLPLSEEAVSDPAFWTVLLDATEKTQAPFLQRTLDSDFWDKKLTEPDDLKSIIGELVYNATKSNDQSFDKHVVINFLSEIQICLGAASPAELNDLITDYQVNLNYHNQGHSFFFGTTTSGIWSDNQSHDAQWKERTSSAVQALPLVFTGLKNIDLVRFKIVIQYYNDIIRGYSNREHIGPLIKRLETRIPDIKKLITVDEAQLLAKPLTVVSLRDVNLGMRKVLPMILCKELYEDKKENDTKNEQYLNIIIDEAHNILSSDSSRETEAWRDYRLETFEEIVKEGRKFGVFLTIASQRPHDISETIISQLHNYFLHRLINNLDIHAIEKAVSYLDKVSFESLPILPTGTCVLSGISAQVPVVVDVATIPPEYEPNNKTMKLANKWLTNVANT